MATLSGHREAASVIGAMRALALTVAPCAGDPAPLAGDLVAALEAALRAARRLLAVLETGAGNGHAAAADPPGLQAAGAPRLCTDGHRATPPPCAAAPALSPREAEILRLLAVGRTDREIAAALSLSPRTVGNHVARIRGKTGTENRTALATLALRLGLV